MQRRSGKKLRTRSPTLTALTVFFLTLISISLASLLFYSLMMNTARTEFKQMAQIVSNATISSEKDQLLDVYAEFHKQNSDFVGWISLEGTSLDYPIMQTIDAPEYYLRRDFNKNYSLAGTPFLDARSDMENGNSVAAGLFCRKMDGRFCRKKPDTDVRRAGRIDVAGVFCRTREGRGPEPLPSLVDSRDLAHQDELYHPVINNRPAILVSVDK